jgi:putative CocE/NonD family hydrolase
LRIGGGGHLDGGGDGAAEATFAWYERHLRGVHDEPAQPAVSVHVQGSGGTWRTFEDWPPPSTPTRWYLHAGGRLSTEAPPAPVAPSTYRYDPADPTPSLGGTGLMTGGAVDNAPLEARDDVLVFTSEPLDAPLELIGPVQAELQVSSSLDHTDFFVRVCDVAPDGRSVNVCDGLQRFDPRTVERRDDGTFTASVRVWPIGHRFDVDHRLRIQVSSGAHPVYARNLGTGEPPATATELRVADQAVHHDATRASFVVLPQLPG